MYKKFAIAVVLVALLGVIAFGAVGSVQAMSIAPVDGSAAAQGRGRGPGGTTGTGTGTGTGSGTAAGGQVNLPPASGELSADEAAALLYLREEEKLAHDVYVTLYAEWGLPVFQNISRSEQTHTDAIKALLDRYGLADPASASVGVFTNPSLQALYDALVAQGSKSVADALKVGAAIEEIDILDLQERLAQTDNADIQQVYNSLMSGSYNHLRAFASNLQSQTGETYQPQHLSAEAYQAIVSGALGSGNRSAYSGSRARASSSRGASSMGSRGGGGGRRR